MAFGLSELGVAAYAAEANRPALAGVFLGVMSAGSAFGGLAYGSRHWRRPLARQFSVTLAVMGVGLLPLALPWQIGAFGVFSSLGGIVMAPALIIQSMLVTKTARTSTRPKLLPGRRARCSPGSEWEWRSAAPLWSTGDRPRRFARRVRRRWSPPAAHICCAKTRRPVARACARAERRALTGRARRAFQTVRRAI